ncbi:hypothetical protein EC919_104160 [Pseudomonas graminis]|jgi:hypothetical protein|uniref:hypothetical protein n=1 Tax=Pseudomonas graminis TaxID=158627 RepID=UPI00105C0DCB|nr:hypothetical protein [Pseudomonas graminis]TDV54424.1 hypothetical protein EC919_104160 [Pseudomonas graminis]
MELRLYKFNVQLPDDVYLALAITGELGAEGQRHTGFVVKDFNDNSQLFHLGRNNLYRQDLLAPRYSYLLIPSMEPETANSIIALLVKVLEDTQGNVPYSIAWEDEEYFDSSGVLVKTDPIDGFTCATFVLEILRRQGMELIDKASWPVQPADMVWQAGILPFLGLSTESLMAQLEAIGRYPRIRPEEALGAAHLYVGEVLQFPTVAPAASQVIAEMVRLSAPA